MFLANIVRYNIIDPFNVDVNFKINAFNYYKFLDPNSLERYMSQSTSFKGYIHTRQRLFPFR